MVNRSSLFAILALWALCQPPSASCDNQRATEEVSPIRLMAREPRTQTVRLVYDPKGVTVDRLAACVELEVPTLTFNVKVGKRVVRVSIADVDQDGDFGEIGTDAVKLHIEELRTGLWFPLVEPLPILDHVGSLEFEDGSPSAIRGLRRPRLVMPARDLLRVASDADRVRYKIAIPQDDETLRWESKHASDANKLALDGWVEMNLFRMRNGLAPYQPSAAIAYAAWHASRYHSLNPDWNDKGHAPADPSRPGFSPAANVAMGFHRFRGKSPADGVKWFDGSHNHRLSFTGWNASRFGIASVGRTVIATINWSRRRAVLGRTTTIVPAPFSEGAQLAYDIRENPRAEPTLNGPGYPITVTFGRGNSHVVRGSWSVTDVAAVLSRGEKLPRRISARNTIRIATSGPYDTRYQDPRFANNFHSILVLPHKPLRRKTWYSVRVTYTYKGRPDDAGTGVALDWKFRTK